MINKKSVASNKVLGLILARGGSKGFKNKNIANLSGKPLIAWTIRSALKSKKITDVVLSTDSAKIAMIAKKFGAQVPFLRPKHLAKDNSPSVDAIEHAIKFLKKIGKNYKFIYLLEPTSPLRDFSDIDNAIKKISNSKADALVSVSKAESLNPVYLYKRGKNSKIKPFKKYKKNNIRRQDLEPIYFLEGSAYISKTSTLLERRTFCHNNTIMQLMPKWKSLEIDDSLDLVLAKAIIKNKKIKLS
jgi:CMP-N,N'-diacetyllegionaminic acid synthase